MRRADANATIECPQCGAAFPYWEGFSAGINADMSSVRVCSPQCRDARLPKVGVQELHLGAEPVKNSEIPLPVELDRSPDA